MLTNTIANSSDLSLVTQLVAYYYCTAENTFLVRTCLISPFNSGSEEWIDLASDITCEFQLQGTYILYLFLQFSFLMLSIERL